MELAGRRVLVTGASRGIGAALARRFAGAGAEVALVARSAHAIEALAAELGGRAYPADLADAHTVTALVARVEADGPVAVLVNNAGVDHIGRFTAQDPATIDEVLAVNLRAPVLLTRSVLPGMVERGEGHVVNVSSIAGIAAYPGLTAYCTSKAGLSHFTAALREELRGLPIGTTLVELGIVPTEMSAHLMEHGPTARAVRRLSRLGLSPSIPMETVVHAVVEAVRRGRRHVRYPWRDAVFPMLVEAPRRLSELLLTGVDHQRS